MSGDALLVPWQGRCYRHIPASSPFGPLETRFAARAVDNRWNVAGEPTLYFAGDTGVAVAEWGRHLEGERDLRLRRFSRPRRLYAIELRLHRTLDIRSMQTRERMGLSQDMSVFLDRSVSRAAAAYARNGLRAEALLVPSMAFLDDPERWILVLFLEQLPEGLEEIVFGAEDRGILSIAAENTSPR